MSSTSVSRLVQGVPCVAFQDIDVSDAFLQQELPSFQLTAKTVRELDAVEANFAANCLNILPLTAFLAISARQNGSQLFSALVLSDKEAFESAISSEMLSIHSDLYLLDGDVLYEYFLEGSAGILTSRRCDDCDLSTLLSQPKQNYRGFVMKTLYDHWPPYCVRPGPNETKPSGFFPQVFENIAKSLNFTIE